MLYNNRRSEIFILLVINQHVCLVFPSVQHKHKLAPSPSLLSPSPRVISPRPIPPCACASPRCDACLPPETPKRGGAHLCAPPPETATHGSACRCAWGGGGGGGGGARPPYVRGNALPISEQLLFCLHLCGLQKH